METSKSPLKTNYCRLPTRAERLFDQVITKTTLSDVSNQLHLRKEVKSYGTNRKVGKQRDRGVNKVVREVNKESKDNKEDSSEETEEDEEQRSFYDVLFGDVSVDEVKLRRPKRKVQFATYAGRKAVKRDGNRKKTCLVKKDLPECTKESVLKAFLNAGLPDYEAIATLPLNVVMDTDQPPQNNDPKNDEATSRKFAKPFVKLLKKIVNKSRRNTATADDDLNPIIQVESPSVAPSESEEIIVDSEAETEPDIDANNHNNNNVSIVHTIATSGSKEASTPLPNSQTPPKFADISCIQPNHSDDSFSNESSPSTPKGPPPNKKKPWNVVDRRGTNLLPPHPVVFDEPKVISNDSIDVSDDDQPLNWTQVHSLAKMDESVHHVFSQETRSALRKQIRKSLFERSTQSNQSHRDSVGSIHLCRRSIKETCDALRSLGKSCRTIVRAMPEARSSRKRKLSLKIIENPTVGFLAAFDKICLKDDDRNLPLTSKDKVLALCRPSKVTTFNSAMDKNLINSAVKIGEGSYGEVFKSFTKNKEEVVIKIVPLQGQNDSQDDSWTQILPELVISLTFGELRTSPSNRTPNFVNTLKASCVSGSWPRPLVNAWNFYNEQKTSENQHPDFYKSDNNWLIILLDNGGSDLDSYKFTSADESLSVIVQVAFSLAAAEEEFEFEHRDLHTGNILVMPCTQSHLEYKVDNTYTKISSNKVKVSIIDFTLARMSKDGYIVYDDLSKYEEIFKGEGDYQFEIYRLMRKANKNNWKKFTPRTNILWLHYLVIKILTDKKYSSRSKSHRKSVEILRNLRDNILNYNSSSNLVQSKYFMDLIGDLAGVQS